MTKLTLKASPTFTRTVAIHVPGAEPMQVQFEFKHKRKDDLHKFLHGEEAVGRKDLDTLVTIVAGWPGQDEPFNRENLNELLSEYPGAATSILHAYVDELTKARLGN